ESEEHHIWQILNSEIKDIIADKSSADIKVHQGFLEAFRAVLAEKGDAYEQLEKIIDSLKEGCVKNVWLTGHSLGGALSSVAAHCLLFFNLPVSGLYTFGAPRVGNTGYRIYMNKKLT
ncbi:MAG: lipase family protein, partial [Microcystaceae cyanobacterium]